MNISPNVFEIETISRTVDYSIHVISNYFFFVIILSIDFVKG